MVQPGTGGRAPREDAILIGLAAPIPMAIAHHLVKRWAYEGVSFR